MPDKKISELNSATADELNSTSAILPVVVPDVNTGLMTTKKASVSDIAATDNDGNGGSTTLNDLSDVDTTGVSTGQVLKYDGNGWVSGTDNEGSSGLVPTGIVSAYAGATAPAGYVLCDGAEYNQTGTYAALFTVLGNTYNTGEETANHFRVPDLKGRVIAGVGGSTVNNTYSSAEAFVNGAVTDSANVVVDENIDTITTGMTATGTGISSGITVDTVTDQNNIILSENVTVNDNTRLIFTKTTSTLDALGDTGGSEDHTLQESESPSHSHLIVSSQAGQSGNQLNANKSASFSTSYGGDSSYQMASPASNPVADIGLSNEVGRNAAHNNVQPTMILNYIIKI